MDRDTASTVYAHGGPGLIRSKRLKDGSPNHAALRMSARSGNAFHRSDVRIGPVLSHRARMPTKGRRGLGTVQSNGRSMRCDQRSAAHYDDCLMRGA